MFRSIMADFRAARDRDPAARGWIGAVEIWLCYPGFKALVAHRFLHGLNAIPGGKLPARIGSQLVRFFTGCEIHPGAVIHPGCFIDHAHGVVIGETAIVGPNATLYQGVTLGGTGKECGKRHPTLGANVVVGAGAIILGNILIGDNAKIGAGSVVVREVPPGSTVVGVPAVVVRRGGMPIQPPAQTLDHVDLPNPLAERLAAMEQRLARLEGVGEAEPEPDAPTPVREFA